MGPTYGALFNATFGNFAEMIIAILAIRAGLSDVVRASVSGSIVGNILFVAGLSMVIGGMRHETLTFNALAAESQAGQMILAVAAIHTVDLNGGFDRKWLFAGIAVCLAAVTNLDLVGNYAFVLQWWGMYSSHPTF